MNFTAVSIQALLVLPSIGLLTWLWFATARINAALRGFNGFDGMHFEVGDPQ